MFARALNTPLDSSHSPFSKMRTNAGFMLVCSTMLKKEFLENTEKHFKTSFSEAREYGQEKIFRIFEIS